MADAAREFASLVLPPRARKVRQDRSVTGVLGSIDNPACTKKYVVARHGFWRLPGKPPLLAAWISQHPPPGITASAGWSSLPNPGYVYPQTVAFFFAGARGVTARGLYVTVAAAKGGGTALRADGVAVWEPRPGYAPCFYGSY
jgi:hypothetical protein